MSPTPFRGRTVRGHAILALGLLTACGSPDAEIPSPNGALPVLTLGEPTLEIGTVAGPEPYAFAAIETVLRLPDGRIAVSDAGATLIRIFTDSGELVTSWGTEGDGPGEFNSLSRLYPLGRDSLMAAERFPARLSVFDFDGNLGRTIDGVDISGDSVFALDSWLHKRFWVDGALTAADRELVRSALDRLPLPTTAPGYRVATLGNDGTLWLKEPDRGETGHVWTRVSADGTPLGLVTIPAAFSPTHFLESEVLGVWRGEADVHFARAYSFGELGESGSAPGWLSADAVAEVGAPAPDMDEVMTMVRNSIRQMAGAQEVYYSSHMSYTDQIDSLTTLEAPAELWVDFVRGDARGWIGVFVHPQVDRMCALAYGFGIPAGWTPGMVACAG